MVVAKRNLAIGHVALLKDAGLIADVTGVMSELENNNNCMRLTMQGHDMLAVLRDKNVWNVIKEKTLKAGISISWEVIKQSFPKIISELV